MCLVIVGHQQHPRWPLLVAANRDEFHIRATAPSAFWDEHKGLLAGRDLEAGGTWMGVTRGGRFAAVTNFRDPARTAPAPRSRGELPLNFLLGTDAPLDYLRAVEPRMSDYAGFNLLVGDGRTLCYLGNDSSGGPQALAPGIYGLSNARLDTPWPKVQLGKNTLATLLEDESLTHDSLAMAVNDRALAAPEALIDHGLHGDMDVLLSAQFISAGSYGTRSTTTILQGTDSLGWREISFDQQGRVSGTVSEEFAIDG
mgnify:FL=1